MTEIIIKWLIPFLLGLIPTTVVFLGKWFKHTDKLIKTIPDALTTLNDKIDDNNKAIKDLETLTIENDISMLWSQLTSKCKKVIDNNYCDVQTMECINQLFDRYHKIGGNHGVEAMVKQAQAICKKGE